MKKLIILSLLLLTVPTLASLSSYETNLYSSSFPPDTTATLLPLPAEKDFIKSMKIRVLVFPHTLRNDWRHGKRDNPKTFQLISENRDIEIDNKKYQHLIFRKSKNVTSIMSVESGREVNVKINLPLTIELTKPAKILRDGNESKSSNYENSIKVIKHNDGFRIINTMNLSEYLKGVVPSESSPSWPLEALKAQAVAARSYAVFHKLSTPDSRRYDVDDTARYQVYTGISHHHPRTDKAVNETKNEILTYNDKVIIAFFHAYSGGETDSAKNIFKMSNIPYCKGTLENFTNNEIRAALPKNIHWVIEWNKAWNKQILMKDLKTLKRFQKFDEDLSYNVEVKSRNTTHNGSIKTMTFTQGDSIATIDHFKLRSTLGWSNFNSYHFFFKDQDENNLEFTGLGWGHHVGMSQWSAYYMAKYQSATYKEILHKFYFDTSLKKL